MESTLEVLFAPAEFEALGARNLSNTVCVVFDVLRATTSMLTALASGAERVYPVREISDALALRTRLPQSALLAGERHGLRIRAAMTGGTDFDFGNSPREFTADRVAGKSIIMTTTNGTRALHACLGFDDAVNLRDVLRSDGEPAVIAAIHRAVGAKRPGHTFGLLGIGGPRKSMISIGG